MPEIYKSHRKHKNDTTELTREHEKALREIAEPSNSSLSAFCYFPRKVNFIGTDREEKIILLLRRHPITNLPWIFTVFVMTMVPLVISYLPILNILPLGYQLVAFMTWYMIVLAFSIEQFLSWFFNVHIVTDERVFDIDFVHLVHREVTDANIDQIQDVTTQVGGVIRTMFDYGNVLIQTAAEMPMIEYHSVPHPDKVAKILRELRVEEEIEKLEGRVR